MNKSILKQFNTIDRDSLSVIKGGTNWTRCIMGTTDSVLVGVGGGAPGIVQGQ